MSDYFQPDFYRFNQDSLLLVQKVLAHGIQPRRLLDLGAGCGIIGIEVARVLRPEAVVLLELQDEFLPCLKMNVGQFLEPLGVSAQIVSAAFSEFVPDGEFDLIVCNPPYYLPGHGELPTDPRRGKARSFLIDSWNVLIDLIARCLSKKGFAFVVIKNDPRVLNQITSNQSCLSMKTSILGELLILEFSRSE
jgi:tRNA1(Val) A37 N6-methylase TrmN6